MSVSLTKSNRKIDAMHRIFGQCPGFCRECSNLCRNVWDKTYYKCLAYGDSHSAATDWVLSWPACGMINVPLPSRYVPVIDRLKHEPRPKEPEKELDGQISIFAG